MPSDSEFSDMLRALARLFAGENRPGGDEAAIALNELSARVLDLSRPRIPQVVADGAQALRAGGHRIASATLPALPLIDWHHPGLESGRIRPDIALAMATAELIGPDGMVFHPRVRVGLFIQRAGLDYFTRTHPAEETFVMLGGAGYWTCNGSAPQRHTVGDYIHHPSGAPHASVTLNVPLIAAWRWTGDIAYEGYTLTG